MAHVDKVVDEFEKSRSAAAQVHASPGDVRGLRNGDLQSTPVVYVSPIEQVGKGRDRDTCHLPNPIESHVHSADRTTYPF